MCTRASEHPGHWGTESSWEKPIRETRAGHMSMGQRGSCVGAGQGLGIRAWWGLRWGRVTGWGLSPFASAHLRWVGPGGGPVGTPTARVPWRNRRCHHHSVLVSGSKSDVAGQFGKCCQGRKVDSEALWGWAAWLPLPPGRKPPSGSVSHRLRLSRPCVWPRKRSLAETASKWSGGGGLSVLQYKEAQLEGPVGWPGPTHRGPVGRQRRASSGGPRQLQRRPRQSLLAFP